MKNWTTYLLFAGAFSLTFACSQKPEQHVSQKPEISNAKSDTVAVSATPKSAEDQPTALNAELLSLLKNRQYDELAKYIHPEKGVQFSMYAFVSDHDKKFSAEDFKKYLHSPVKFTWGETDGEGKKLVMPLKNYLQDWVFKRDFTKGKLSVNTFQGHGNSLNNLEEKFPGALFTENYIEGTEKYSGMDWYSLRFVFEQFNGKYYLVAIINDQWTI